MFSSVNIEGNFTTLKIDVLYNLRLADITWTFSANTRFSILCGKIPENPWASKSDGEDEFNLLGAIKSDVSQYIYFCVQVIYS